MIETALFCIQLNDTIFSEDNFLCPFMYYHNITHCVEGVFFHYLPIFKEIHEKLSQIYTRNERYQTFMGLKMNFKLNLFYQHSDRPIFGPYFLRKLSHLTHDLSQAEKKITVVTSWATDKMTTIFAQNDNVDHFE